MAEWGPEKFTAEVRKKLDWSPDPAAPGFEFSDDTFRDHLGVNAQSQPGLNWIGLCILSGRLTDEQVRNAADVADKYGQGEVRLTNVQNMLIPHVATEDLEGAKADLSAAGFEWDVPSIRRGAIACTGIEFCNLAITETKLKIKEVVGYLETVTPNPYERGLKINMNGCPNSCAQHHVGDIGLQGCLARLDDGSQVEAYDIHLGGDLGMHPSFTRAIHRKVPAEKIKYALGNVIQRFQETRQDQERFAQWAHRHTNEELDAFLGVETIVGAPDLPVSAQGAGVTTWR